eukprot:scaffold29338_cov174-Isochrysis_galbana.AAC.1
MHNAIMRVHHRSPAQAQAFLWRLLYVYVQKVRVCLVRMGCWSQWCKGLRKSEVEGLCLKRFAQVQGRVAHGARYRPRPHRLHKQTQQQQK